MKIFEGFNLAIWSSTAKPPNFNHACSQFLYYSVVFVYMLQESFEQAVPYFTHAIEIYEVHLGRDDPTVETAITNKELALSKLQSQSNVVAESS